MNKNRFQTIYLYACVFAVGFFLNCALQNPASASPVTFSFQGNIIFVDGPLAGTFNTSQAVSGSFTFESSKSADIVFGTHDVAIYFDLLTNLTVDIGGYTVILGPGVSSELSVTNNHYYLGNDAFQLNAFPVSGASVAGWIPDNFFFQLHDATGTVLSDTSLPLNALDPSALTSASWYLGFVHPDDPDCDLDCYIVLGDITSMTTVVPVPGAAWLFGSGLAGIFYCCRKKKADRVEH